MQLNIHGAKRKDAYADNAVSVFLVDFSEESRVEI